MPELLPTLDELIEDEPALEIAMPQVFRQPTLTALRRGSLPNLEWRVARLYQDAVRSNPDAALLSPQSVALGPDYQEIVNEFQPLFRWGTSCWDYLLTVEGCRFARRSEYERPYYRGDYRAVTNKDYSRLLHRAFRQCVVGFAQSPAHQLLETYLRNHFWAATLEAYRRLEDPSDPRQRKLTAYSYLRCVPYQFFNRAHQRVVDGALARLPRLEHRALSAYFLRFHTIPAAAAVMQISDTAASELLHRGLLALFDEARLAYALLRQIERY